jgi:hypothetical protein
MRAEVKYFEWPDLERGNIPASDLQSTLLVFAAGPLGQPGEETFQVTVCTPEFVAKMVERDGIVIGRHLMFVASVDTARAEDTVRDRLRRIDGDTWSELAAKIGRIGLWEFEDYTPAR